MTPEQMTAIESRVSNESKSTGVAYLLWFFLGTLGGHNFYLGRVLIGVIQLVMALLAFVTFGITLIVVGIWLIVDAFMIPGIIRKDRERIRTAMALEFSRT